MLINASSNLCFFYTYKTNVSIRPGGMYCDSLFPSNELDADILEKSTL